MTQTLDPELLQAFIAVADQRSFTRAAVALNRTQSAVSMQVKRLEERLKAELFHRTKSNVDLSAAGEGCSAMRDASSPERGSCRPGARAQYRGARSAWA